MGIEGLKWHTNVEGNLPNSCKDNEKDKGPTLFDAAEIWKLADFLEEFKDR